MSQHPSYGKSTQGESKRNVLSRKEKLKIMKEKASGEIKRVTGFPKIKAR